MEAYMAGSDDLVTVSAALPRELFDALVQLAKQRGVSANTIVQEAIAREKYFSDQEASGASILIEEKDKTFKKLSRKK
jgi:predicted DNA-binding protein